MPTAAPCMRPFLMDKRPSLKEKSPCAFSNFMPSPDNVSAIPLSEAKETIDAKTGTLRTRKPVIVRRPLRSRRRPLIISPSSKILPCATKDPPDISSIQSNMRNRLLARSACTKNCRLKTVSRSISISMSVPSLNTPCMASFSCRPFLRTTRKRALSILTPLAPTSRAA